MVIGSCGAFERSSHPLKRNIPAIALTAFTRDIDRVRALTAGFDRHMPRPLNAAGLIEAVQLLAVSRLVVADPTSH